MHDIQEWDCDDDDDDDEQYSEDGGNKTPRKKRKLANSNAPPASASGQRLQQSIHNAESIIRHAQPRPTQPTQPIEPIQPHPDIWAAEVTVRDRMQGNRRRNSTGTFGNTHVYGISSGVLTHQNANNRAAGEQPVAEQNETNDRDEFSSQFNVRTPPGVEDIAVAGSTNKYTKQKQQIYQNIRRMINYIEEPNEGKGFIKELCFSSDGRVICSPYGSGLRLLAFSKDCTELPGTLHPSGRAQTLYPLKYIKCHSDIVVSTKFSPRQPLFASGCMRGRIVWHQPIF